MIHLLSCSIRIAFPQAILQMAAIVIYKEANPIAIVSIFISLLSVASKSLVFMMGVSNSIKQLLFNWLCAVTDFFGIFFVVCWVFYEPNHYALREPFELIQDVWLWKLYIFELPGVLIPAFLFYLTYVWAVATEDNSWENRSRCNRVTRTVFIFIGCSFLLAAGCIAAFLVAEIMCWTWFAGLFFLFGSSRMPGFHKLSLQFYFTLIKWINSAEKHQIGSRYKGCTSYTKQQDKMMRLASVNHVLHRHASLLFYGEGDSTFNNYLEKHRVDDQYMEVTFSGLRTNTVSKKAEFLRNFWSFYGMQFPMDFV